MSIQCQRHSKPVKYINMHGNGIISVIFLASLVSWPWGRHYLLLRGVSFLQYSYALLSSVAVIRFVNFEIVYTKITLCNSPRICIYILGLLCDKKQINLNRLYSKQVLCTHEIRLGLSQGLQISQEFYTFLSFERDYTHAKRLQ